MFCPLGRMSVRFSREWMPDQRTLVLWLFQYIGHKRLVRASGMHSHLRGSSDMFAFWWEMFPDQRTPVLRLFNTPFTSGLFAHRGCTPTCTRLALAIRSFFVRDVARTADYFIWSYDTALISDARSLLHHGSIINAPVSRCDDESRSRSNPSRFAENR